MGPGETVSSKDAAHEPTSDVFTADLARACRSAVDPGPAPVRRIVWNAKSGTAHSRRFDEGPQRGLPWNAQAQVDVSGHGGAFARLIATSGGLGLMAVAVGVGVGVDRTWSS